MKKIIAALAGAGLVLGAAPAFAGEWRLDARRCADTREDWRDARENRRDERFDYSRRDRAEDRFDRREDRRDRSITICPRSAFYYVSDRGEWRGDGWRGADRHYDRSDRRHKSDRRYKAPPKLKLKYDRTLRLNYTYDHGRKIYVRG